MNCKLCNKILDKESDQIIFCSKICSSKFYIKTRKSVECPKCNKILKTRWNKHIENCGNPVLILNNQNCDFNCGKPALFYSKHSKKYRCSKNTMSCPAIKSMRSVVPWNKGKSKYTCEKIASHAYHLSNRYALGFRSGFNISIEKTIEAGKKGGGPRERGGRSKTGKYQGILYQSSWELAWIKYQLDHGLDFIRNKIGFDYKFNGKTRKYYPDFYQNGSYIEIKGYSTPQWEAKMSQFKEPLIVLYEKDLTYIFDYAINNHIEKDS